MTFFVERLNSRSDEVMRVGEAPTLHDAIAIAKGVVDRYLTHQFEYEASADALYTRYKESGIIPCIFRDDGESLNVHSFDHLNYASIQCFRMCREKQTAVRIAIPSGADEPHESDGR